jgi:hypothetical protein
MLEAFFAKPGGRDDLIWNTYAQRRGDRSTFAQTMLKSATFTLGLLLSGTLAFAGPAEPDAPASFVDAGTGGRGLASPKSYAMRRLVQDSGLLCRIACVNDIDLCTSGCIPDESDQCAFRCRASAAKCRREC